jgi:hypothetical protein
MDEVEALTNGVVEGLPEWSRRSNVRVHAGPASAVLSYTAPSAAACEVRVYDSPVYARPIEDVDPAAGRHLDSRPGTFRRGAERDFTIGSNAALASSTQYWYKLSCGGETAVGSFRTTAAAPAISVRLGPAPAGAVSGAVEYGPTVDLGSSTGASVCSSGCTIAVPAGQRFYRWVYLDGSGRRIFVSDPVMVPGA